MTSLMGFGGGVQSALATVGQNLACTVTGGIQCSAESAKSHTAMPDSDPHRDPIDIRRVVDTVETSTHGLVQTASGEVQYCFEGHCLPTTQDELGNYYLGAYVDGAGELVLPDPNAAALGTGTDVQRAVDSTVWLAQGRPGPSISSMQDALRRRIRERDEGFRQYFPPEQKYTVTPRPGGGRIREYALLAHAHGFLTVHHPDRLRIARPDITPAQERDVEALKERIKSWYRAQRGNQRDEGIGPLIADHAEDQYLLCSLDGKAHEWCLDVMQGAASFS